MAAKAQTDFLDDSDVYTGLWMNRAVGPVHGATLTLDRRRGGFLIAFLALYVGMTGKSFWRITRFLLHSHFSSTAVSDGIYHQRQALLRNAKTGPDALETSLHIMFAWRNRGARAVVRLLPVLALSSIVAACFVVAGIMSSRVVSDGTNEVLLAGSGCATNISGIIGEQGTSDFILYRKRKSLAYLNHALECYQVANASLPQKCHIYTKPTLQYSSDRNADCPFSGKVCQKSSGNLLLETGYLDSIDDLGLNVNPRFLVRMKHHCAPLATQGFTELYTNPSNPSTTFMRYKYGQVNPLGTGMNDSWIYEVPVKGTNDALENSTIYRPDVWDYQTRVYFTSPEDRSYFTPISELNLPETMLAINFLSSDGLVYRAKSEDPWFSATQPLPLNETLLFMGREQAYASSAPASVMGCAFQVWYCNPKLPEESRCGNLYAGGKPILERLQEAWPDPGDFAATAGYMSSVNAFMDTPDTYYQYTGLPNLLAKFSLNGPIQMDALPSTKWQDEMEYTFQAFLVSLQSGVVEATRKGAFWANSTVCGTPEACQKYCHNQKIRSPQYYSFSVLGIGIILCTGLLLMILAAFAESIGHCVIGRRRKRTDGKPAYAMLEWETNSVFQLQRLAHDAIGMGSWTDATGSVPVTKGNEALGILDLSNPEYPRLKRHGSAKELRLFDTHTSYDKAREFGTSVNVERSNEDLITPISQSPYSPFEDVKPNRFSNRHTPRPSPDHSIFATSRLGQSTVYKKVPLNDHE